MSWIAWSALLKLRFDAGSKIGLTSATPGIQLFSGVSQRFCARVGSTQSINRRLPALQPHDIIGRQPGAAAFDDTRPTLREAPAQRLIIDGDRNVLEQPQQPQADSRIGHGVSADLLDGGVQQAIQVDPRQHDT
jgi:hypothetical protein